MATSGREIVRRGLSRRPMNWSKTIFFARMLLLISTQLNNDAAGCRTVGHNVAKQGFQKV